LARSGQMPLSYGVRELWGELSMTYYFWPLLCVATTSIGECIGEAGKGAINISLSLPHRCLHLIFVEEEHLYKASLMSVWLYRWKAK